MFLERALREIPAEVMRRAGSRCVSSCMPCLAVSSDGIALGRITADQMDVGV
jgi:hypothetical protein